MNSGTVARDSVIRSAIVRCVGVCGTSGRRAAAAGRARQAPAGGRRCPDVGADDAAADAAAADAAERDAELRRERTGDRGRASTRPSRGRFRRSRCRGHAGQRGWTRGRDGRWGRGAAVADAEAGDRLAERGCVTGRDEDFRQPARDLGLVDDRCLVRLDLDERVALGDLVSGALQPLQHRRLLHRVRESRHPDVDKPGDFGGHLTGHC